MTTCGIVLAQFSDKILGKACPRLTLYFVGNSKPERCVRSNAVVSERKIIFQIVLERLNNPLPSIAVIPDYHD